MIKRHYNQILGSLVYAGILMSFASPSLSESFQSHNSIKLTAEKFLVEHLNNNLHGSMEIEVTTGRLDPRLRLRQCKLPLEPFLPPGANLSGNTSIGIRCEDNKPWSLYVSAKIIKYADVYVSTRYLQRGIKLKQGDFILERHNISSHAIGYVTDINAIEGKILRRPLRHNVIIPPIALHEPMLIKRGEEVTILAKNMGIKVHMKGKALKNGSEGEVIRVQNLSSKRIIEGKVLSAGVVGVRL